ncbi:serine threonine- kinase [Chlorella sorokiniana]|uniref:Serine threonine-kinase n=1 Tax=Chlorella sorokiniana TaxID=3076 RepID=A0A2P6TS45_CHLSO|nr:serine threonine- kinase [Chlorella sorokiniana]|eukprot:PRW56882.1 serine threonine- kinase [Chlorella sorokiniana]
MRRAPTFESCSTAPLLPAATPAQQNQTESTILFYSRGTANITEYPPGYTVPWTSGYVLSRATKSSSSSAGAIAGGIAGAVAAVLLAAGFLWWRRHRRGRQPAKQFSDNPDTFGRNLSDNMHELETAWHTSGGGKGGDPPGGSSGATAGSGTTVPSSTPDTAMVLHGSGSGGPVTPGSRGSGPIPELPFASALLTASDYKVDVDASSGKPVLLGSGHFANVYRGVYGAEPAAIKVIKEPGLLDRESLLREVAILKSQHLVSFLGASLSQEDVVIVTELMAGGTLWRALKTGKVTFYRRGLKIAIDVARGLHYLHARSIIHLDLKSPNVLLTEHGRAKVADVGLARMIPATQSYLSGANVSAGTWPWASPEQLFGQRCTSKADIYGYGVVLWEICTQGVTPVRGHMREVK